MENLKIPEGYQRVMPYLILADAEKFLEFTERVFGAKEKMKIMEENGGGVMHAEIVIGDSVIMVAESRGQWGPSPAGLYVYVENADETYQRALEEGAAPVTELSDQSYGRTGGVKDTNGNIWWIVSNPS